MTKKHSYKAMDKTSAAQAAFLDKKRDAAKKRKAPAISRKPARGGFR